MSCRYHLGIQLGARLVHEVPRWDDGRPTCALDVAEEGEHSQPEVAEIMSLTHQRIAQIEQGAQEHARRWRRLEEARA